MRNTIATALRRIADRLNGDADKRPPNAPVGGYPSGPVSVPDLTPPPPSLQSPQVSTPGPAADLIDHAARIIVEARKQPYTGPGHWAGALWKAGMLVSPGTANTPHPPRSETPTPPPRCGVRAPVLSDAPTCNRPVGHPGPHSDEHPNVFRRMVWQP